MRTVEIPIFKYEELNEKAKEKVRNHFWEHHSAIETDMLTDEFTEILKEEHPYFEGPKFQWSLSCSQGDGLSFSCDNFNLRQYIRTRRQDLKTSLENLLVDYCDVKIKGNTGRYCYCSKDQVVLSDSLHGSYPRIEKFIKGIEEDIADLYILICINFETRGYEAYERLGTDEYAKEVCDANEYEFYENGKFY